MNFAQMQWLQTSCEIFESLWKFSTIQSLVASKYPKMEKQLYLYDKFLKK